MNSSTSSKKAKPLNDFSDDDIQIISENITNTNKDNQNPYDYVEILEMSQNTIKGSRPLAAAKSASKMGNKACAAAANKSTEDITMTSPTTSQSSAAFIPSSSKPSSSTSTKRSSVTVASTSKFATDLNHSSKRPSSSKTSTAFARPNFFSSTAAVVSNNVDVNMSGATPISACSTSSDATSSSPTNSDEQMDTTEPPDPLEQRLQILSDLNSRSSPTLDDKMTKEIIQEIVPIIFEVIPNAIINEIGPALHECGSFLNLAFDEKTHEVAFVWFFFSLSIMIGDKETKQLQTPDPVTLKKLIKKIETRFKEEEIVQHSVIQRGTHKLIFQHSKINAKVTLLFCAADACRRSQLIRLYARFYPQMIQVAYLYNTMILSNPALHLFTNTPLCYMIIYFLQQTDRIEVMHKTAASTLIDKIDLFQPNYRPEEDIEYLQKPNPKYVNDSVAFLTYEFAKFYASFDFEKIIIDIAQKKPRFWSKKDAKLKKPIAVRCCFSERNLASQVSAFCLSTFQSKMKEVVKAFKAGNETTVFKSDLEDFAKKFNRRSQR